jgi:hypothetical protein
LIRSVYAADVSWPPARSSPFVGLVGGGGIRVPTRRRCREKFLPVRRQRSRKGPALRGSPVAQLDQLIFSFHAFGDDVKAEIGTWIMASGSPRAAIVLDLNERLVDFDLVEQEVAKIAQAGVARAEIVECHAVSIAAAAFRVLIAVKRTLSVTSSSGDAQRLRSPQIPRMSSWIDSPRIASATGSRRHDGGCANRQPPCGSVR